MVAQVSKQPKILLRVDNGCFVPYDANAKRVLRERDYRRGEVLAATLSKPRNPGFYRLAHGFGHLVADNIDDFDGMAYHQVLKRIQLEGNIACDTMFLRADNGIQFEQRIPQSLSFASMDEGKFRSVFGQMAEFIARKYWPDMDANEIEQMAQVMPEAV